MILNAPHSVASVKRAQHTLLSPYCLVTLVLFPHFSGPSISFVYVSMMLCLGSICSTFSCTDFFFPARELFPTQPRSFSIHGDPNYPPPPHVTTCTPPAIGVECSNSLFSSWPCKVYSKQLFAVLEITHLVSCSTALLASISRVIDAAQVFYSHLLIFWYLWEYLMT